MRVRSAASRGWTLLRTGGIAYLLGASALLWPAAARADEACAGGPVVAVSVPVLEAELSVRSDFSLSEIERMASQVAQAPPHPALGFYRDRVGYRLRLDVDPTSPCPRVELQAQLVALERRIEIGRELRDHPCELRAAVAHYRRHAAAASLALRAFASDLDSQLKQEVARDLTSGVLLPAGDATFQRRINAFLDASVAAFSRSLTTVQATVDTPMEVRALSIGCTS